MGSDNVFADLGLPNPEKELADADAQAKIIEELKRERDALREALAALTSTYWASGCWCPFGWIFRQGGHSSICQQVKAALTKERA